MSRLRTLPWKRILLLGTVVPFLLLVAVVAVGYARTDVPEPDSLAVAGATRILYADGSEMGRTGEQNRLPVTIAQVPQHVQDAVLAAEDRGFYTEPGISPKGILRALLTNVRGGGGIQQGGSTITQQYAKNAFLADEDGSVERTYTRKIKEVFIALKMSRTVPKHQILEDYLNTIYFGRGAYGIQVASQTYFGKPVSDLTPAEGAVLASSIRSPAAYDPESHPERALDRWNYVLDGMVEKGWLDAAERAALTYPAVQPASAADRNNDLSGPKGHVMKRVMEEVEQVLAEQGESARLNRGLTVTTTIRREAQDAAIAAVQDVVGDGSDPEALQGALVSVEPGTGAVVAYYGGATGTGFDYAGQGAGRQPGSSFKPYVLAAALEDGMSLRTTLDGNSPKTFPGMTRGIENYGGADYGRVDLITATQKSVNTAYYELGMEVGPEKVADLAHRAGIPEDVPLESAHGQTEGGISLGSYEVHVIDQAVGYASFASGGRAVEPYFVESIMDGSRELYTADPEVRLAFSKDVAADATYAMQQVVQSGTGTRARLAGGRPAAGKTGTSSDNKDAWFVGYTPQLSTAVWLGYGTPKTIRVQGVEATGGGFSTRIWKSYMDVALEGQPVEEFPEPANIGRARSTSSDDDTDATRSPAPRRSSAPTSAEPTAEPDDTASPQPSGTRRPTATTRPTEEPATTPPSTATPGAGSTSGPGSGGANGAGRPGGAAGGGGDTSTG